VDYYATAEGKAGEELRAALHAIISRHHVVPYSSTALDTSDALKILDRDPVNTNYVVLIYSGSNAPVSSFGTTEGWNREHQWCNSYGIDGVGPAYSDLFNLRAIDANVNSARSNKYYDFSDTNSPGYKKPANAEAVLSTTDSTSWQPPVFDRGDIARAMFYMATRYTGDATNEPKLTLTEDVALIGSTNLYMGRLSTLLAWHKADPVDDSERQRNDEVYSLYQSNRNPFVDFPAWVNLTFAPAQTNPPVLELVPSLKGWVLSWAATNQSSHLEFSTNLAGGWVGVSTLPTLTNGQFQVTWTNGPARAFFRLRVM